MVCVLACQPAKPTAAHVELPSKVVLVAGSTLATSPGDLTLTRLRRFL